MKYKVGDKVKVLSSGTSDSADGKMGTVLEINVGICNNMALVEIDAPFKGHDGNGLCRVKHSSNRCWYCDPNKLALVVSKCQSIHIYTDGTYTTAILKEGKDTIKTAKAKCNPSDTYDFATGAKLAFERLFQEDKPKTNGIDWDAFKSCKIAVHCRTEEDAKAFLIECDAHGIHFGEPNKNIDYSHCWMNYGSLTCFSMMYGLGYGRISFYESKGMKIVTYNPQVREVKRPAKVGEWIKIVEAFPMSGGRHEYKNGDVFCVRSTNACFHSDVYAHGVCEWIDYSEYVVLENYKPEEKQ